MDKTINFFKMSPPHKYLYHTKPRGFMEEPKARPAVFSLRPELRAIVP
jgi:hypothetical protein